MAAMVLASLEMKTESLAMQHDTFTFTGAPVAMPESALTVARNTERGKAAEAQGR